MTVQAAAQWLRERDNFLLLTHVRPDGDTLGSAAALCQALNALGKTAYVLKNPGDLTRYEGFLTFSWAPEGFVPDHVVAVDIATEVIDRIHTTATSHGRCMVIELMGNKAGWLTLYAGLAGGADVILLPEVPYDIKKVAQAVEARAKSKKPFSIIAVAEGAMSEEEAKMKKKEREAYRATLPYDCISKRIAAQLSEMVGVEARHVVPGHIQRGGSPSAYDRVLSTQFGVHAAQLIRDEIYGVTVALDGNEIIHNKLKDIAGVPKPVPKDDHVLTTARNMGICMGD